MINDGIYVVLHEVISNSTLAHILINRGGWLFADQAKCIMKPHLPWIIEIICTGSLSKRKMLRSPGRPSEYKKSPRVTKG
jgi:hypothetical protein